MTNGISLGQVSTESEAKDRVQRVKDRIKYVIKYNKLKIKASSFKVYIQKDSKDYFGGKNIFPYYIYVDTPSIKYNWIFLA